MKLLRPMKDFITQKYKKYKFIEDDKHIMEINTISLFILERVTKFQLR